MSLFNLLFSMYVSYCFCVWCKGCYLEATISGSFFVVIYYTQPFLLLFSFLIMFVNTEVKKPKCNSLYTADFVFL